jgi:hypothetical protein
MNDAVKVFEGALARIDHDRIGENEVESRGVNTSYGVYQNVRLEAGKVFGDLHLWDCDNARKVMSIAERTPNAVGNSIHAGGIVKNNEDGTEIVEQITPRTKYGFRPSIDLVEDPAATIGLYQSKRNINNSKETNTMELKDLTLEMIKTGRSDLFESIKAQGFASRDKEVEDLEQERDEAVKKSDDAEVKQAKANREVLASKLISESSLPEYAITDVFRKQLVNVTESKDGDKMVTVEENMKSLIQDRIDALEPGGVKGNGEKDVRQNKPADKINDEDFVNTFKR